MTASNIPFNNIQTPSNNKLFVAVIQMSSMDYKIPRYKIYQVPDKKDWNKGPPAKVDSNCYTDSYDIGGGIHTYIGIWKKA